MKIKKLIKQMDKYKYGGFWKHIKTEIEKNPYIGLTVAIMLLLLGAFVAGIINFISTDDQALIRFIFSFAICLLILAIGFIFFLPYWDFRRRYSFLDEQENTLTKKIVSIYNRSKQSLISFNGINAIQFFKLETHTDDNHVLFSFKKIFSLKSKYFDLSKLKDKEFEVPIALFDWLQKPEKPAPDYGPLINVLLYEWMIKNDEFYSEIIDNWEVTFEQVLPKLTSIHYHALFEPKKSVDINDFCKNQSIDSVFTMKYNGVKEEHNNRKYNSLRITINDENEGIFEGFLLIISNSKQISNEEIVDVMKKILKQEGDSKNAQKNL